MVATNQQLGERNREDARQRSRQKSEAAQDIGEYEPCQHPEERAKADGDFRYFVERYFPAQVSRAWSDDHLTVLAKLQRTVVEREWFAVAMPRGSGKTTLCMLAVVWAVLTGRHQYALMLCGTAQKAIKVLNNIKSLLRYNDLLYEDYPEAIHAIRALNGETRRCEGQRYRGEKTAIQWGVDKLGLAMIPGAKCAGAIIHVSGITGDFRGAIHVRPDGVSVRPTLVLEDDPQTDESARSAVQTAERMDITHGAVAGLAGPGEKIAIMIACTVIAPGDMAQQVLDREKFPQWRGEKTVAVKSMPTNMDRWDEYKEVWNAERLAEGDGSIANAFYEQHRDELDENFVVSWPARKENRDVSAQQHMMHIYFDRGSHFFSEMQNEPLPENLGVDDLEPRELAERIINIPRGTVPVWATQVTMFIDVQKHVLYYMIVAWGEDFSGVVIDYGTFPEQAAAVFSVREVRRTLGRQFPGAGDEGALRKGLESLTLKILAHDWPREGGASMRVSRCLIDANYLPDVVYEFCRRSPFAAIVMPRWGKAIGPDALPFDQWKVKAGERHGFKWLIKQADDRAIRSVLVETNGWKSFTASRLQTPIGDHGALAFFGKKGHDHRMLIDHLTAETRKREEGDNRTVDIWEKKPGREENHFWDCLVGCAVGASIEGVHFEAVSRPREPRKKVSLAEKQRAAFARQGVKAG